MTTYSSERINVNLFSKIFGTIYWPIRIQNWHSYPSVKSNWLFSFLASLKLGEGAAVLSKAPVEEVQLSPLDTALLEVTPSHHLPHFSFIGTETHNLSLLRRNGFILCLCTSGWSTWGSERWTWSCGRYWDCQTQANGFGKVSWCILGHACAEGFLPGT